jgi:hypothetical protein
MPDTAAPICLICGSSVQWDIAPAYSPSGSPAVQDTRYWVTCELCGKYSIDVFLATNPPRLGDIAPFVSAATRQASELGRSLELKQSTNFAELADPHRTSTISQHVEKLLRLIAEKCGRPGNSMKIVLKSDYPLADCEGEGELAYYLKYLCEKVGSLSLGVGAPSLLIDLRLQDGRF